MVEIDLGGCDHFQELQAAVLEAAKFIADPDIAQAVDGEAATGKASLEGSTFVGSLAEIRVTCSPMMFVIQILSFWSIASANGATSMQGFLSGLPLLFLTQQFALCRITFGEKNYLPFHRVERQMSPLGAAMMPCICPSWPLKFQPAGGDNGFPELSNLEIV